jgi:hypothetical protein
LRQLYDGRSPQRLYEGRFWPVSHLLTDEMEVKLNNSKE